MSRLWKSREDWGTALKEGDKSDMTTGYKRPCCTGFSCDHWVHNWQQWTVNEGHVAVLCSIFAVFLVNLKFFSNKISFNKQVKAKQSTAKCFFFLIIEGNKRFLHVVKCIRIWSQCAHRECVILACCILIPNDCIFSLSCADK